ncbi:MAG: hypothetical protein JXB50_09165 [Spirochaetes bacterium]|nr:hypothetical protein [Spirochaetota bacterium]
MIVEDTDDEKVDETADDDDKVNEEDDIISEEDDILIDDDVELSEKSLSEVPDDSIEDWLSDEKEDVTSEENADEDLTVEPLSSSLSTGVAQFVIHIKAEINNIKKMIKLTDDL